jgi:chromosome segregation ATPase
MGEVKKLYVQWPTDKSGELRLAVLESDYARLERERDELVSLRDTLTAELDRRFRRIAILESSVAKCQNNDAELTRLRAVEAAANNLISSFLAADGDPSAALPALAEALGRKA